MLDRLGACDLLQRVSQRSRHLLPGKCRYLINLSYCDGGATLIKEFRRVTKKALKVDNLFSSLNTELALLCLFLLGGLSFDTAAYSAQDMEQSQAPSSPDVSRPAQETDALVVERGPFELSADYC